MSEFPRIVYKDHVDDCKRVENEDELSAALEEGWSKTIPLPEWAKAAAKPEKKGK